MDVYNILTYREMAGKTKKIDEKNDEQSIDSPLPNPFTSMIEFWQKYSTNWMEQYGEFIKDIQRIGELQKESLKNTQRMSELYKELVGTVENMNLLYKESVKITERMTRYWVDYSKSFFQKEKEGSD